MDPIVIDHEFVSPVDDLWAAWTEPQGLCKWLCSRADIELEVGGRFDLGWNDSSASGGSFPICHLKAFEEEYSFTAEWKNTGQFAGLLNGPPPRTQIVVRFQPLGPGRCRLHFVHEGWGDDGDWKEARAWHQAFWDDAFKKLKPVLESGSGQ